MTTLTLTRGLKELKLLKKKLEDLRGKMTSNSADMDDSKPSYGDTPEEHQAQFDSWKASYNSHLRRYEKLRQAIAMTNLNTQVEIEVSPGIKVSKSIFEWITRKTETLLEEQKLYANLGDRGLRDKPGNVNGEVVVHKLRRYYKPKERDQKREELEAEQLAIDATLEEVNAITLLVMEVD